MPNPLFPAGSSNASSFKPYFWVIETILLGIALSLRYRQQHIERREEEETLRIHSYCYALLSSLLRSTTYAVDILYFWFEKQLPSTVNMIPMLPTKQSCAVTHFFACEKKTSSQELLTSIS